MGAKCGICDFKNNKSLWHPCGCHNVAPGSKYSKTRSHSVAIGKMTCHPEEPPWLLMNDHHDRKACKGATNLWHLKALYPAKTNQLCMLVGSEHATLSTTECVFSFGQ